MDVPNKICRILRKETLLGVEWGFHVKRIHQVHETELVDLLRVNIDGSESWKRIKEEYYNQQLT